jgi:putative acetyltransferase
MKSLSPGLELRAATNADCGAVTELVVGILARYGLSPDHTSTDVDLGDLEGFYHKSGGCFDVLIDTASGRVVGSVGLWPLDPASVELRKMYVRAAFRGRGLGRFLLDHALVEARRRRFNRVVLETATVLKEALQLYRSAGFQPCEALHAPAKRCDLTMELRL